MPVVRRMASTQPSACSGRPRRARSKAVRAGLVTGPSRVRTTSPCGQGIPADPQAGPGTSPACCREHDLDVVFGRREPHAQSPGRAGTAEYGVLDQDRAEGLDPPTVVDHAVCHPVGASGQALEGRTAQASRRFELQCSESVHWLGGQRWCRGPGSGGHSPTVTAGGRAVRRPRRPLWTA
jgi:hypothetical protein